MRRFSIISATVVCFLTCFHASNHAKQSQRQSSVKIQVESGSDLSMDRPLEERSDFSTAPSDTVWLGRWKFESASSSIARGWTGLNSATICDPFGWCSVDVTAQLGRYWHVADATELDGGAYGRLIVLAGMHSLWCGAARDTSSEVLCGYASLPGYGNNWNQGWCSDCFEVSNTEAVYIDYLVTWDSEPGYDYTYVEYATKGTCDSLTSLDAIPAADWIKLRSYNKPGGPLSASDTIPSDHGGAIKIRFHFVSDEGWSDEDGLWNTDGAIIIDSLSVTAESSGLLNYEDFEAATPGDQATGAWACENVSGYGDFAGLYSGQILLQEDRCRRNFTDMWTFINGTDVDYSCGGHAEQPAVPYMNERGQYIHQTIRSPMFAWGGPGTDVTLQFDVYRDLPVDGLVFYYWEIRSINAAGCPGSWKNDFFIYYGSDKDWYTASHDVSHLIQADAVQIQAQVGVIDMCKYWCTIYGSGSCHSHAPLFDNINLFQLARSGPRWSVRDIDLFNDSFPTNGTSTGTGRIDMAIDKLPTTNPSILPGDSAKVVVRDPEGLRTPDPFTGFGAAVYFFVRPENGTKVFDPNAMESDYFGPVNRWPYVGTVNCGGETWYQFRMDTCFAELNGPRTTPLPDAFCIDLNDNYFTNGDTLWFFFGAENAVGVWTYWSDGSGRTAIMAHACTGGMEMQILPGAGPARGGDILYVDNFSGSGGQPYFDSVFQALDIYDLIDRFDKRGASSLVGNAVGHLSTTAQLIDNYRRIIWNSGNLSVGTVGDGTYEKADDYQRLFEFLDLHTNPGGAGIYLSGDDLAEELNAMTSTSSQNFKNVYIPHTLVTGDHKTLHRISPRGIGEAAGTSTPPTPPAWGIFDNGVLGVDTIIVFGGCPVINDFDVIAPQGITTLEMCYNPASPADDSNPAVLACNTLNSLGNPVSVVLAGFSFHYVFDDRPQGVLDRIDHMWSILQYLGNILEEPMAAKPEMPYPNSLAQNYPNPFNPSTTIRYSIKERAYVSLQIYNVAGQLVRTLVNGEMNAGAYAETWNGRSNAGTLVSSGVYFCKLATKEFEQTRKMVVIK